MGFSSNYLERYQKRKSLLHDLDPRVKIIAVIAYIISNLLIPDGAWIGFLAALLILVFSAAAGRISAGYLLPRSLIALPFALSAITLLFTIEGQPIAQFQFLGLDLVISDAGWLRFVSILIRSWLSVQMAIILTVTTRFPDLAHGLLHLKMPAILISVISFMYRYLFVLIEETQRMLRARASRSAGKRRISLQDILWQARIAGNMVGQLFIRSFERSERIYHAMLARGYDGEYMTLKAHHMQTLDWLILLVFILLLFLNHLI